MCCIRHPDRGQQAAAMQHRQAGGVAFVVLLPITAFARDHRRRDYHAVFAHLGEGAVNTVAAGARFIAKLQWSAASLAQTLDQFFQCCGSVRESAIWCGLPNVSDGGDRDDDRVLVYIRADKSCRLFHDPSPVPEAPRRTTRRDPRSLHKTRRVTPSGWRPQGSWGEGSSGREQSLPGWFQGLCPWRVQGRALALLPSLVPPGRKRT